MCIRDRVYSHDVAREDAGNPGSAYAAGLSGGGERVNRMVGVGLTAVLVASLVGVGSWQAVNRTVTADPSPAASTPPPDPITIQGIVGTEKREFFADPAVQQRLAALGLTVEVQTAGSRQMAASKDLKSYDFAFPSSAPDADKIVRATKPVAVSAPFYSPIAIASYKPIVDVLRSVNVARPNVGGYMQFDIKAYLELVQKGTRWDQLPGNATYPARKAVLVSTNDVRSSNAAAMYLAIGSYVANGNKVVRSQAEVNQVMPVLGELFLGQGYSESWSESSFDDYLALGPGKTPMMAVYESQFLEYLLRNDGSITSEMVLMYPTPDVLSKHTLIGLTPRRSAARRCASGGCRAAAAGRTARISYRQPHCVPGRYRAGRDRRRATAGQPGRGGRPAAL